MKNRASESGNVLIYILIAVMLLAALSFAVSQGERGSAQSLTGERRQLVATDIIDYSEAVSKAATQLRLRSIPVWNLSFAHADLPGYGNPGGADAAAEIFNVNGGAVNYREPMPEALTGAGGYVFSAVNEVDGIGSTCGDETCTDLIMITGPLQEGVCTQINEILGIAGTTPVVVSGLDLTVPYNPTPNDGADEEDNEDAFALVTAYSATIGEENADLMAKNAACVRNGAAGDYYFYRVLISR